MNTHNAIQRAFVAGSLSLLCSCGALGKNPLATGASAPNSSSSSNSISMRNSALSQQAIAILQNSCASCHGTVAQGGVGKITDPTSLLSSGLVIPGSPTNSPLIVSITSGGMPIGGTISAAQLQTLESWIQTEFVETSVPNGTNPSPSPSSMVMPTPTPTASIGGSSNPALNAQVSALIQNDCASCHGPNSSGSGGFNYITDLSQMISKGLIVPGNASGSIFYQKVNGGSMQGYLSNPSTDLMTINSWISTMSSNPSPLPSPSVVPLTATYTSIHANIVQPKCVGCHSGESTYSGLLHWVSAGNPGNSSLYTTTKGGDMPTGGIGKLSASELTAISTWITNGALNN